MIDARWIIASVFKDLLLSGLREIRLRQTEFSICLVEQLSSTVKTQIKEPGAM